jgi:hypothetical protein
VTFDELCVRGSLAVLVCIEMFFASLAHKQERFFGYKTFKSEAVMGFGDAFVQMVRSPVNLADEVQGGIQELGAGVMDVTSGTLYNATETLYSGGALAMDGVESLRKAADDRLGQLAGGSLKNLTGISVFGETSPGSARAAAPQAVNQEADRGGGTGGRARGVAPVADSAVGTATQGASLLEEAELRFDSSFSTELDS